VPADTPVTNPVFDTVATAGVLDTHGFVLEAVPLPVNCMVNPEHTDELPVIVGFALTVTGVTTKHPKLFV
jgi:hypothetical protein